MRFLLQQLDGQHVGGRQRHRDHVRAERAVRDGGSGAERVEHLLDFGRRRQVRGNERPAALQFLQEEALALVFGPGRVVAQPQLARDRGERLGVARRVLPQVEAHERDAEGGDAPLQIEQPAARQQAVAGLFERTAAQGERLGDLLDGHQRQRVIATAAFEPILDRAQRRRQPVAHVAQQQRGTARRPRRRARAARRCRLASTARAAGRRSRGGTGSRPASVRAGRPSRSPARSPRGCHRGRRQSTSRR